MQKFCASALYRAKFIYLESGDDGSENVCEGPYQLDKTGQNFENVEEFVAGLRVEQRGKLDMVSIKL